MIGPFFTRLSKHWNLEFIIETTKKLELIRSILDDKKAEDVRVLDVRGLSTITDYFIIASGHSGPQLKAMAGELEKTTRDEQARLRGRAGTHASEWIVLDYFDIIVHLFLPDSREFYDLESLWADAKEL